MLLSPIQDELRGVTDRLLSALSNPIAKSVTYLIAAGGKRLRPALVLLAGATGHEPNRQALIDTATVVEIIHTATLIHDDIIDEAPYRRKQPAFHNRWGTERAVLMGDYLYATAFTLLDGLNRPRVTTLIAQACQELSRGELCEVEARYRLDLSEEEYFSIIRDKTASLIRSCCQCGAYLGGANPETIEGLGVFGLNFGLAFQIIDDCLDLTGDQQELGKSINRDLDRGAVSLPMIYLCQALGCRERNRLFAPLRKQERDPEFLARVTKAAQDSGAIARAKAHARKFVRQARVALEPLHLNGFGATYQKLTEYAVKRRS